MTNNAPKHCPGCNRTFSEPGGICNHCLASDILFPCQKCVSLKCECSKTPPSTDGREKVLAKVRTGMSLYSQWRAALSEAKEMTPMLQRSFELEMRNEFPEIAASYESLHSRNQELEEQNKRYREALEEIHGATMKPHRKSYRDMTMEEASKIAEQALRNE